MCLLKHLKGNTYNRAVEYTRENYVDTEFEITELEIDNVSLMRAFLFIQTEEGFDYWLDMYNDLKKQQMDQHGATK